MTRNNHIYFLYTLAIITATALASCSRLNPEGLSSEEISIRPFAKSHTKAIIEGTSYPDDETFGLWTFHTESTAGTSWAVGKGETYTYLDNVAFHKNGQSWAGYDYATLEHKPYYWPTYGSMFFAAYSPYALHEKVSYDKETGTFALSEYTLDPDNYLDFMYAEIGDLDNSVFKVEKSMLFKHALSLIEFTAQLKNPDDAQYIDIHSITTYPIPSSGSFTSRDAESQQPQWIRNLTPEIALSICDAEQTSGVDNGYSLTANSKTILGKALVIPGNAVQIEIRYRIHYAEGKHLTEKYLIIPTDAVLVWEPGKKYSYHITLGVDFIEVMPSIGTDWNEIY